MPFANTLLALLGALGATVFNRSSRRLQILVMDATVPHSAVPRAHCGVNAAANVAMTALMRCFMTPFAVVCNGSGKQHFKTSTPPSCSIFITLLTSGAKPMVLQQRRYCFSLSTRQSCVASSNWRMGLSPPARLSPYCPVRIAVSHSWSTSRAVRNPASEGAACQLPKRSLGVLHRGQRCCCIHSVLSWSKRSMLRWTSTGIMRRVMPSAHVTNSPPCLRTRRISLNNAQKDASVTCRFLRCSPKSDAHVPTRHSF